MIDKLAWKNANLEYLLSENIDQIAENFQGVMVGWSAGLDSTVLFEILRNFLKQKKNFSLAVCHMNFGLRGQESEEDMRFVESRCREFGVPCHLKRVASQSHSRAKGESIQLWARRQRRQWFQELAEEGWAIALAHQKDDLAENVLLRLARGSSTGKLAGMKVWQPPFFRPLLHLRRDQLANWLEEQNFQHREDSSNAKIVYSRNKIRHSVLKPLNEISPRATDRIAESALQGQQVEEWASQFLPIDEGRLPIDWLLASDEGVCLFALRRLVRQKGIVSVQSSIWRELYRQLKQGAGVRVHLDQKWQIERIGSALEVRKRA